MSKAQVQNKHSINDTKSQVQVITRFAPSPTGTLHLGGAHTALFNYLFARQNNGKFILRIEDTDIARSKKEYEDDILAGLKWLGFDWDEFYRQSERKEIYKKYLERLINEDKAYFSKETEGERESVIRFRNPNKKISFNDLIRGDIQFDTAELEDFVIAKDLESPLFHFTVVVDDAEMEITHIIRGEDHISNTPRQILIQEALGFKSPFYAHMPLMLGPDRTKLSKRHGAVSVNSYCEQGYLAKALINFLALIGWNPGTEKEIYDMEELIREFSIKRIQKSAAIFNIERLDWFNFHYIKQMDEKELADLLPDYLPEDLKSKAKKNHAQWVKIVALEKERITKLPDIKNGIAYFFEKPEFGKEMLLWKQEKDFGAVKKHLGKVIEILDAMDEKTFMSQNIKEAVWNYVEEQGRGNVLWPFRVALSGLEKSPDPFIISEILGKEESLNRLHHAIEKL
ncbi:glutamate--tRNA ligase [Patescibacteria group bacterium]|nr:glutamate--tRNA ligase [Patescibacteria group bacterium]MBU4353390.1 glutamate--tRNA ligase [Patescibacteria group bacterium]MBU4477280.1 glutamate--tRNA ligase [Patescibacteria group bacterium]MCG2699207.1 glutamate--tRNA ligase [Candidatus Parcubacteria bacterium]